MRKFRRSVILLSLVAGTLMLVQVGCKSSPQSTDSALSTQASPSPGVTAEMGQTTPDSAQQQAATGAPGATSGGGGTTRPAAPPSTMAPAPPKVAATPAPPRTFTLAAGTPISIFTESDLSTKTARSGQSFTGSLANAIVDGDWVIARQGAPVQGVVVTSDPGGKVKGVASISVRLDSITLADGRNIDLSTGTYVKQAKTTKKKDAAKIGIGAGVGAAIGAIAGGGKGAAIGAGVGGGAGTGAVLATRGDPAVIPGESKLTFRTRTPVTITKR